MNNKEKLYLVKLAALPLDNRGPRQDLPDGQLPPPRHNPKPGQPGYGFKKAPPTDTYASLPTAKGGLANIPPRPAAHPLSKQMYGDPDPEGWKNLQARRARGMPVQPVAQYPDKGDKMLTPNTPPVLPTKAPPSTTPLKKNPASNDIRAKHNPPELFPYVPPKQPLEWVRDLWNKDWNF